MLSPEETSAVAATVRARIGELERQIAADRVAHRAEHSVQQDEDEPEAVDRSARPAWGTRSPEWQEWTRKGVTASTPILMVLVVFWTLGMLSGWNPEVLVLAAAAIVAVATGRSGDRAFNLAAGILGHVYDRQEQGDDLNAGVDEECEEDAEGETCDYCQTPDHCRQLTCSCKAQLLRIDSKGRVDWSWLTAAGGGKSDYTSQERRVGQPSTSSGSPGTAGDDICGQPKGTHSVYGQGERLARLGGHT
jgi:hypothetical protein